MAIATSDYIASAALVVSVIGTAATLWFNYRQKGVNASQRMLNERLIAREDAEARAGKEADVSTAFVPHGSNDRRFKVFNRGKAAARNIRMPQRGVDLIATQYLSMRKRKFQVKVTWDDDTGSREKIEWPTL